MREVLKYLPEEEDGTASSAEVDGVGFGFLEKKRWPKNLFMKFVPLRAVLRTFMVV